MAAMIGGPSSGGRGKPLNIEYNLVPFIDLLSCCIAFLAHDRCLDTDIDAPD